MCHMSYLGTNYSVDISTLDSIILMNTASSLVSDRFYFNALVFLLLVF